MCAETLKFQNIELKHYVHIYLPNARAPHICLGGGQVRGRRTVQVPSLRHGIDVNSSISTLSYSVGYTNYATAGPYTSSIRKNSSNFYQQMLVQLTPVQSKMKWTISPLRGSDITAFNVRDLVREINSNPQKFPACDVSYIINQVSEV